MSALTPLSIMKTPHERVEAIARDIQSGTLAYKDVDPEHIGELVGLDWEDNADWEREFLAEPCLDEDGEEVEPDFSDLQVVTTTVRASDGFELKFEACVGDGGELFDFKGPYQHLLGDVLDRSKYVEVK